MSGSAKKLLHAAAGTAASGDPVYVEDVFATHLRAGTGSVTSNQDVGIDLADKGGMVWTKDRDWGNGQHVLSDTVRGINDKSLNSASTAAEGSAEHLNTVTSTGFTVKAGYYTNNASYKFVDWVFAKQKGFFDVQTASLDSSGFAQFSHNLGAAPGMVLVKPQNFVDDWYVYHKSLGTGKYMVLNSTAIAATFNAWGNVSSTTFDANIGFGSPSGKTVVAYFFADGNDSNAQVFGEDGDEAVIKTGTYQSTGNGDEVFVNLGFEPQWVMIKTSTHNAGSGWIIQDNMMGLSTTGNNDYLLANTSGAENSDGSGAYAKAAPNGMTISVSALQNWFNSAETYIYVAIRRGPMKEPSAGTDVFGTAAATTNAPAFKTGNLVDLGFYTALDGTAGAYLSSRLIQGSYLTTSTTGAKATLAAAKFDFETGWYNSTSFNDSNYHGYGFRRYPKVFDIATYKGNGSNQNIAHNLGVTPGFVIVKSKDQARNWSCWHTNLGNDKYILLNTTGSAADAGATRTVNSTNYQIFGSWNDEGVNGENYIIFLFATLAGISKVGTYEGNGSYQEIDCGFSAQARFVMIKNTEDTTGWQVWDSARGLSQSADPYWQMNGAAEVTGNKNYVYNTSSGFGVQSISGTNNPQVSVSGDTYIYLAFA